MRVLITNDDGIDSHGIAVLARVAVEAGHDVVVAAPHEERSGASASLSALQNRDQLVVSRASVADLDVDAFAVQASPAMIAFVATRGAFGPRPDILLSGINHGPNTGSAVLHSGTVGAALTASTHGVPAMALSLAGLDTASLAAPGDIHDQIDREVASGAPSWDTAHLVARRALDWFVDHGAADWVLNVNIPRSRHRSSAASARPTSQPSAPCRRRSATPTTSSSPFASMPSTRGTTMTATPASSPADGRRPLHCDPVEGGRRPGRVGVIASCHSRSSTAPTRSRPGPRRTCRITSTGTVPNMVTTARPS